LKTLPQRLTCGSCRAGTRERLCVAWSNGHGQKGGTYDLPILSGNRSLSRSLSDHLEVVGVVDVDDIEAGRFFRREVIENEPCAGGPNDIAHAGCTEAACMHHAQAKRQRIIRCG
jgi:hypothetical protein